MISSGAYSKRYQAIEKEKMREMKDREGKIGKERSLFLSIQTSQRQRAMEEKKRAMAEAEEERRRKALEDRRQSQQQATDRFRSALGRIKFSKPTTAGRKLSLPVKPKVTRCSYLHKNSADNVQSEQRFQAKYNDPSQTDAERLAVGKEVEITPPNPPGFGVRRKSPSLDDVFNKVKGSEAQPFELSKHLVRSSDSTGFGSDKRKSASDSDLDLLGQTETRADPQSSGECKSNETAVFYPSARSSPVPVSRHPHLELTSVSPTPMCKVVANDSCLVEDDLGNSPDSLMSSVPVTKPAYSEEIASPSCAHYTEPYPARNCEELPTFVSAHESDVSVTDSLEENSSINSNVSPFKSNVHDSEVPSPAVNKQPVGILKNKGSGGPLNNFYGRSRFNSLPRDFSSSKSTPDPSQVSSTSSRSQKKVRFSDQVEITLKNSSPMVMNISDPVQIELWKKVFPKEFPPQPVLPNSAFTPKLRCSLSSKTPSFQGMYRPYKKPSGAHDGIHDSDGEPIELLENVDEEDDTREHSVLQSLDKTPTDAEINSMWDQIRQCLQDGKRVSVPPRLFNFKPPTENGRQTLTGFSRPVGFNTDTSANTSVSSKPLSSTRTYSSAPPSGVRKNNMNYTTQKHLVYRQPNQARMRSHSDNVHPHLGHVTTQYAAPMEKEPIQLKNRMQSAVQSSSREPSHAVRNSDVSETNLSLEEQRLMQSIERINRRLKDHLHTPDAPDFKTQYYPVPPSTAPKRHPTQNRLPVRVRGLAEASKPGQSSNPNSRNHSYYYKQSSHIT